jgi:hypothetical protein
VQVILYPSEMGEPLQRDDLDGAGVGEVEVGVIGYPEVVQDAKSCYHTMGISFEGGEKGFLDFLTLSNEGQCQEDPASVPKPKGSRDVKNLECSISFDVRSVRSCWGEGKKTIHGMWSRVLLAGLRFGLWVLVSRLFVGFCGFSLYFFFVFFGLLMFGFFFFFCILLVCLGVPYAFYIFL